MKRKILISTSTFPKHSGDTASARFVLDLARALEEFYEVHILAPHSRGAMKEENIGGLRIHRFRYFFPENLQKLTQEAGITPNLKRNRMLFLQLPFLFVSETAAIARVVLREKIHIVNSHWIVPQGLAAALLKRTFRIKHLM